MSEEVQEEKSDTERWTDKARPTVPYEVIPVGDDEWGIAEGGGGNTNTQKTRTR